MVITTDREHPMTDFEFHVSDHVDVDSHASSYGHSGASDHVDEEQTPVEVGPHAHQHHSNPAGRADVISAEPDHAAKDDAWQYDTNNAGKIDMVGSDLDGG